MAVPKEHLPTQDPADFFPFFGAGEGHYYEWAEVAVRFRRAPTDDERRRILRAVPEPINPKGNDDGGESAFAGKMLLLGSNQFVNMANQQAYGQDEAPQGAEDADHDEDLPIEFWVTPEAAAAFEADLERWLRKTHRICPIEFACRQEDWEAGGTTLSEWHTQSVQRIPALLAQWADEPGLLELGSEERENFKDCVAAILNFGGVDMGGVPDRFVDNFFPEVKLAALLKNKQVPLAEALAYYEDKLGQHAQLSSVLDEHVGELIKAQEDNAACDLLGTVMSAPGFLQDKLSSIGRIARTVVKAGRRDLQNQLVELLSDRGETSWNTDCDSCCYSNNIGVEATELMKSGEWQLAIGLFDLALSIRSPQPPTQRLELYANALYPLQHDNSGLPVDSALNRRFLARTLPFGPRNPGIYFNAACLYVEMGEFDEAVEMVKQAIAHRYDKLSQMKTQFDTLAMFEAFRTYPAYREIVFPQSPS